MWAAPKQVLALAALAVVVIAGLAGLAQLKFTSFLSSSIQERLQIVAATSARDFEAAIDLGLSVAEVANGEVILDRARSHDENIRSIRVFDLDGEVLHVAGSESVGSLSQGALEAFRLAQLDVTETSWTVEGGDHISSGSIILGGFGRPTAGVLVEYPTTEFDALTASMARRLTRDASLVAVGLIVLMVASSPAVRSHFHHAEPGDPE